MIALPLLATFTIGLIWDRSPSLDVTNYIIHQKQNTNAWAAHNTGTNLSLSITNIPPGATNIFYATAVNDSGLESIPSNYLTNVVPNIPLPPSNLKTNVLFLVNIEKSDKLTGPWEDYMTIADIPMYVVCEMTNYFYRVSMEFAR